MSGALPDLPMSRGCLDTNCWLPQQHQLPALPAFRTHAGGHIGIKPKATAQLKDLPVLIVEPDRSMEIGIVQSCSPIAAAATAGPPCGD